MNIEEEKLNLTRREIDVTFEDIFPKLDRAAVLEKFKHLKREDPHETIFKAAKELWIGGYEWLLREQGFYSKSHPTFTGHCHQTTPALALVLKTLGFNDVAYLECYRIEKHFPTSGIIKTVSPEEEPNPEVREEFQRIGRIPYCTLEVKIEGLPFYVTSKHLKPEGEGARALLSAACYKDFIGVFHHQENQKKSGIYLQTIMPVKNPDRKYGKFVVWRKKTSQDQLPELFATYLRMNLK